MTPREMAELQELEEKKFPYGQGRTVAEFDVVDYRPSNSPFENHHGLLDVWATYNIPGYNSRGSDNPTIALTKSQHDATKVAFGYRLCRS